MFVRLLIFSLRRRLFRKYFRELSLINLENWERKGILRRKIRNQVVSSVDNNVSRSISSSKASNNTYKTLIIRWTTFTISFTCVENPRNNTELSKVLFGTVIRRWITNGCLIRQVSSSKRKKNYNKTKMRIITLSNIRNSIKRNYYNSRRCM